MMVRVLTAGELVTRISEKHGYLVPALQKPFSEAAGVPNEQWRKFAEDPSRQPTAIQGEPLSLVLWKLNPLE